MRLALVAALVGTLITSSPATSAATEPERCVTLSFNADYSVAALDEDTGVSATTVGHYLWFQLTDEEPSSLDHLVSLDLVGLTSPVTFCHGDTTTPPALEDTDVTTAERATYTTPQKGPTLRPAWQPRAI